MEPRFYNTLSRQLETFQPIEAKKARMYHCGPTVYARPHIGNYRAFLFADLLRRFLEHLGYEVLQVMNLTDVGHLTDDADDGEDKLQAQAARDKIDPWVLVENISKLFFADLDALGVQPAHHYPRATQHIDEMVEMVQKLIASGHAYRVGDNVYFDVHSYAPYGKLSGNKVDELEAGARLEINTEKRHPADFALWKSDPHHIMKWDTPFGEHGFPGWHIECSAMSRKYLGDHFDIHTGGEDNVFPHHECEIAQSVCATETPFVNLWMHTKFLQVDGGKMSKSLGNVYSLDDLAERGASALDFRFLILRAHYRGSVNFTFEALTAAVESRRNLHDFRGRLSAAAGDTEAPALESGAVFEAQQSFMSALCDDLNTSAALASIFSLRTHFLKEGLSAADAAAALHFLDHTVDSILGIFGNTTGDTDELRDGDVEALLLERTQARADKNWARADAIRDELASAKIVLEDGPDGLHWHRA
ncbi:MAG: cysteine--tRNA ligase [Planctomycetes bacterium]|nr:cysteine--tRNA ligase [Planctomycetota bacterium]MBT4027835.1 cysteine--tRNA ligase [Planctomycetota bacterium]MBT4560437.1 cysteine--tRNA ligase [Planctomycetota bacterium]MBT5100407.1 cysteine--tRNA ligase [Planctomycetota bacterium]MBT5119319.1 cysteine--tRNA ligase [Planctomycetota bacterium]